MPFRPISRTWMILFCILLICLPGCVRRRMTVRTNPPGAMVYVDHQSIGTTPVSTSFVYYGTRQFEVIKDGYRTEKFLRKIDAPWYQWPVLEFVSETLWPFEQRDERIIDVTMSPDTIVPTDSLIRSGEELRSQATRGVAVGQPPTIGATAEQLVIPRGDAPFPNQTDPIFVQPTSPGLDPNLSPNVPISNGPSIFNAPPFSIPAADVTPGASFRQPVP